MTTFSLIQEIARKEVREIVRDGRLRLLGGIVVILALAALLFGVLETERAEEDREHAQERSEKEWEGQGEKNPHVAAHYGTHIFAPTSVATALDPGVSAYLGRSVKIEAHQQNLADHSEAEDAGSISRMGSFSVATVLLQLVPLLIIALGYGLWSVERERGTLRQLISTGVDRRALFWGKGIGLFAVLAGLLIPAGLIIVGTLWILGGGDSSTLIRLGILGCVYSIYFAIFGGLTLYASAVAPSSRAALVVMIGAWGFFCLIVPRGATEMAGRMEPLPSQAELAREVGESMDYGFNGSPDRETSVEEITTTMMAEQGMADAGIMVDAAFMNGIELQAEAAWEDRVFDHHVSQLNQRISLQEHQVTWAGFLSPYVAMRSLSAGLCGTDYAHHRHFTEHVETWRKSFVGYLNIAFAENAGEEGWDYKASPDLWKKAPPFSYDAPRSDFAIRTHLRSLGALLFWLILALGLALRSAQRVKVVA